MNNLLKSYNETVQILVNDLNEKKLSKTKVSAYLDITTHTLKSRISGKSSFTIEELGKLADILNYEINIKLNNKEE